MGIVIYPPTLDWTWMKQRPQHLMRQLAKAGHTVYYCNRTRVDSEPQEVEPNLYIIHHHEHWLQSEWPSIRKRSNASVGVWSNLPFLAPAIRQNYAPDWVVYDCADEHAEWFPQEQDMVSCSDLVICTSERLLARMQRAFPGKRTALIRNGYDPEMKLHEDHPHSGPAENNTRGKKQVGYVGAWAPWIDIELLREISKLPHAEVTAIGPEFGRRFDQSAASGQINFLGLKPHDQLPDFIRQFAVCIIPFRMTPLTLAVNPIKAYEYLASGNPVVSAALPECRLMEPHVDVASTRKDFVKLVAHRLEEPGDATARKAFALANTWEQRGHEVLEFIQPFQ